MFLHYAYIAGKNYLSSLYSAVLEGEKKEKTECCRPHLCLFIRIMLEENTSEDRFQTVTCIEGLERNDCY